MSKKMTVKETFEKLPEWFVPSNVPDGWDRVIQYNITGPGGGKWYLIIKDKKLTVKEGEAEKYDIYVEVDADTYVGIFEGTVNPLLAMRHKKMIARGAMADIMVAGRLFKPPKKETQ